MDSEIITYQPTQNALETLKERYLIKNSKGDFTEDPDGLMWRVAKAAASVEEEKDRYSTLFHNVMASNKFLPNSPTLMNAGTQTSMLSACFVLPLEDTMESILRAVSNSGLIFKLGGGVGLNFSKLRPQGSYINTTGGYSSGPVAFMSIFDSLVTAIAQGGKRRGAFMGIMSISHPDILTFISCKTDKTKLNGFNISVGITDSFISKYKKDPNRDHTITDPITGKKAKLLDEKGNPIKIKQLLNLIATRSWTDGEPGLVFLDRLQKYNSVPTMPIHCTNPSIPDWSPIITKLGVRELKDINIGDEIWGLDNWVTVTNKRMSGVKKVYKYTTNAGCFYGSDTHKIFSKGEKVKLKDAKFIDILLPGRLISQLTIDKKDVMDGLVIGDGCYYSNLHKPVVLCIGDKDDDYFSSCVKSLIHRKYDVKKYIVDTTILKHELSHTYNRSVPDRFIYSDYSKMSGFLLGLFSANGDVLISGNSKNKKSSYRVSLRATSKKLVDQVQLMLSALGIGSYITTDKSKSVKFNNGTYKRKESYKLNITRDIDLFHDMIGFVQKYKTHKLADAVFKNKSVKPRKISYEIKRVDLFSEEKVYDITVDNSTHSFWTWGFHTCNCGEVPLTDFGSCNLGSINVSQFVAPDLSIDIESLKETTYLATRYLDNIVSINDLPLPEIKRTTESLRNIGLGIMGFADMLYKMKVPYNSDKAVDIADYVYGTINRSSHRASLELGKEKGNFPLFRDSTLAKEYTHHRNSTCTVIAPTGTLSKLAACSSGIEPLFNLIFNHNIMGGFKQSVVSPIFKSALAERGIGLTSEDIEQIYNEGTIKNVKSIPDDMKKIFVSSHDVSPEYHLKMQEVFQKHTDCSVSKTINLPNKASKSDVLKIYDTAINSNYIKGVTVYRDGSRSDQPMEIGSSNIDSTNKYNWLVEFFSKSEKTDNISPAVKIRQDTPFGTLHVTLVLDKDLKENEVFAQLGKSGDIAGADLEAICRLSSKLLQSKFGIDKLIKQLIDIGTSLSLPTSTGKVVSLPDALAKSLKRYQEIKLDISSINKDKFKDTTNGTKYKIKCPQCEDGKIIFEEGCSHCDTCTYAQC